MMNACIINILSIPITFPRTFADSAVTGINRSSCYYVTTSNSCLFQNYCKSINSIRIIFTTCTKCSWIISKIMILEWTSTIRVGVMISWSFKVECISVCSTSKSSHCSPDRCYSVCTNGDFSCCCGCTRSSIHDKIMLIISLVNIFCFNISNFALKFPVTALTCNIIRCSNISFSNFWNFTN